MRFILAIICAFFVIGFVSACTSSVDQKILTGKWKYVKVGVPNSSPPDTVTRAELEENAPSIEFKPDNNFVIIWGGKVLSHGSFTISGKNLKVSEDLAGKKRDFQFYISELSHKSITFETTGRDGSRVTAIKE